MLLKPSLPKILFYTAIAYFLIINFYTLHDGQGWGGDFAQYIIHAQNILNGKNYTSGVYQQSEIYGSGYPPGYPLLISLILKYFGLNFYLLKVINIFFWLAFTLTLFSIFKKHVAKDTAILLAIYFLFSPYFFIFKQEILSDLPFLFFATLSLLFLTNHLEHDAKNHTPPLSGNLALSVILMSMATCTRTAGVALFLSALLYLLVLKRDIKAGTLILVFLLLSLAFIESYSGAFRRYLTPHSLRSPQVIMGSISSDIFDSLQAISAFFFLIPPPFLEWLSVPATIFFSKIAIVIFGIISALLIYRTRKKQLTALECFAFLYWAEVSLWPYKEGVRLFLPLVGLITLFIAIAIKSISTALDSGGLRLPLDKLFKYVIILGIAYNSLCVTMLLPYNNDVLYKKENQQLFSWVRNHIEPGTGYLFFKPRTLALMTGRTGLMFPKGSESEEAIYAYIRGKNINFAIFHKVVNAGWIRRFEADSQKEAVWENSGYKIFRLVQNAA